MEEQQREYTLEQIKRVFEKRCGRMTFTIERGKGETYNHGKWTLYAHDTWPKSSVLSGLPRRTYINSTGNTGSGRDELEAVALEVINPRYLSTIEGSTHIPVDELTAGLPEDEDY